MVLALAVSMERGAVARPLGTRSSDAVGTKVPAIASQTAFA